MEKVSKLRFSCWRWIRNIWLFPLLLLACTGKSSPVSSEITSNPESPKTHTALPSALPTSTFDPIQFDSIVEEIFFPAEDGVNLAGQFDYPPGQVQYSLVFIIPHADPIDRQQYQFLAAKLIPAGYAVFRFDKRGVAESDGEYGCCEAEDAVAAYRAALNHRPESILKTFIIAQSIGTKHLFNRYNDYVSIHRPTGVILLSNLLSKSEVIQLDIPIQIIVSDSEPHLVSASQAAFQAHISTYGFKSDFYVALQTEHTLFDISQGPIDWNDPGWPGLFDKDTWNRMRFWLDEINNP
jgi:uncharacterized protein